MFEKENNESSYSLMKILGYLGCLARARLSFDNQNLVLTNGINQIFLEWIDW